MKLSRILTLFAYAACWSLTTLPAHATLKQEQNHPTNKMTESNTMKFNNYAYIFLGPGLDPKKHRSVIKTDSFTFTAIGIDFHHKDQAIEAAKEAIDNGAQIIELCGGFGPLWIAKISDAIHGQVPVGSVAYGPEARKPLLDLLT